jgi:hypothetical protein
LKKKTGIIIDEYGNRVLPEDKSSGQKEEHNEPKNANEMMFNYKDTNNSGSSGGQSNKNNKKFTPIDSYKPSGNLVYNKELIDKIGNKFS